MFETITIGIKTFLRDEKLFRCIEGIRRNLPKAQIIVADCGDTTREKNDVYADLERDGHKVIWMPFDAGFGAMSNAIVDSAVERPYLLIGSDDFDFTPSAAAGIELLQEVLDTYPHLDVASGRVRNMPYEFYLYEDEGLVREHPVLHERSILGLPFIECDLTVNYCLVRKEVFWKSKYSDLVEDVIEQRTEICWDNDVRIGGGEHGSWFLDLKRAGYKVGWVPGVSIDPQQGADSELYTQYRNRARSKERPCFDRRGVKQYVLGTGQIDYESDGGNKVVPARP
jgi:hypothetical protein